MTNLDALAGLSAVLREQQDYARELEAERNVLLRAAVSDGATHSQIARATGLTRARVGQIALHDR